VVVVEITVSLPLRRVTVALGRGTPKAVVTIPETLPLAIRETDDNKKQRNKKSRLIIPPFE
jgi:hypothetical protein